MQARQFTTPSRRVIGSRVRTQEMEATTWNERGLAGQFGHHFAAGGDGTGQCERHDRRQFRVGLECGNRFCKIGECDVAVGENVNSGLHEC